MFSQPLPIFINKFAIPYEMDNQQYMQIYNKFTQSPKHFKLDEFLQIGALKNQSLNDLMKKIKIILTSFMNNSVKVYPSLDNIQLIYGTG